MTTIQKLGAMVLCLSLGYAGAWAQAHGGVENDQTPETPPQSIVQQFDPTEIIKTMGSKPRMVLNSKDGFHLLWWLVNTPDNCEVIIVSARGNEAEAHYQIPCMMFSYFFRPDTGVKK